MALRLKKGESSRFGSLGLPRMQQKAEQENGRKSFGALTVWSVDRTIRFSCGNRHGFPILHFQR